MNDHWSATKGLSVYNALKLGGDMPPMQITEYLREHWSPDVSEDYVYDGVQFLAEKRWIGMDEDKVRLLTRGRHAGRCSGDADLALGDGRPEK